MGKYTDLADKIPWRSRGQETVISRAGRSLVPIGLLPFEPVEISGAHLPQIQSSDPKHENYILEILATAIQAGEGKLVTCGHVAEKLAAGDSKRRAIVVPMEKDGEIVFIPYPVPVAMAYIDPRSNSSNMEVDLALLVVPAKSTPAIPYQVPVARWGDSGRLGVGDEVIIGGYPYGKRMFLTTSTNRAFVQPTFYHGIVSAMLPATKPTETRIMQLSIPTVGGMSGGAVFDPKTGEVLGMVTSGMNAKGDESRALPITYALPSEVIAPFVQALRIDTDPSP